MDQSNHPLFDVPNPKQQKIMNTGDFFGKQVLCWDIVCDNVLKKYQFNDFFPFIFGCMVDLQ